MNKYRHLLFDLDHTLWDFNRNSRAALDELFSKLNLSDYFIDFEDFLNKYHKINAILWDQYGKGKVTKSYVKYERFIRCLRNAGCMNDELGKSMAEEYVRISPCKTYLVDGAMEVLEALAGKYRMYIITNGFIEVQYKKIKFSGLSPYFSQVFISEEIGYQKPEAGFFQFVFQNDGIRPDESLVIGDNLHTDIAGAKEYGIDTVFFNPDFEKDFIGATYEINRMPELLGII